LASLKRALEVPQGRQRKTLEPMKRRRVGSSVTRMQRTENTRLAGGVPRHLRRRTRSHIRRSMPLKLRLRPLPRCSSKPANRMQRRVRSVLRETWRQGRLSGSGVTRLETHTWTAKRMAMDVLWNHYIGTEVKDKGFSAITKVRSSVDWHDPSWCVVCVSCVVRHHCRPWNPERLFTTCRTPSLLV
jgi:hypothetical protein